MKKLKEIFSNKKFLIIGCSSILVILIATLIIVLFSGGEDKENENHNTTTITTTKLIETETTITLKDDNTNVEVVYTGKEDLKETLKVSEFEISKELRKQNILKVYDIKLFDENNQEIINKEKILVKIPFDNEKYKYNSFIATKLVNNELSNNIDAYYDGENKCIYFYVNEIGTYGIVATVVGAENVTTTKNITTTKKNSDSGKNTTTANKNTTNTTSNQQEKITTQTQQVTTPKKTIISTAEFFVIPKDGLNYVSYSKKSFDISKKIEVPADPVPPTDMCFKGWGLRSANASVYDFNTTIPSNNFSTYYDFYAIYYRCDDTQAPTSPFLVTVKDKNGSVIASENVLDSTRIKLTYSTYFYNTIFEINGGNDNVGITKYEIYMDYGPVVYVADNATSIIPRDKDSIYHRCGYGGTEYIIYAYDAKGNKSKPVRIQFCIDE